MWLKFRFIDESEGRKSIGHYYMMAGPQIVFNNNGVEYILELISSVNVLLKIACDNYRIKYDTVQLLQITLKKVINVVKGELDSSKNRNILFVEKVSKSVKMLEVPV